MDACWPNFRESISRGKHFSCKGITSGAVHSHSKCCRHPDGKMFQQGVWARNDAFFEGNCVLTDFFTSEVQVKWKDLPVCWGNCDATELEKTQCHHRRSKTRIIEIFTSLDSWFLGSVVDIMSCKNISTPSECCCFIFLIFFYNVEPVQQHVAAVLSVNTYQTDQDKSDHRNIISPESASAL